MPRIRTPVTRRNFETTTALLSHSDGDALDADRLLDLLRAAGAAPRSSWLSSRVGSGAADSAALAVAETEACAAGAAVAELHALADTLCGARGKAAAPELTASAAIDASAGAALRELLSAHASHLASVRADGHAPRALQLYTLLLPWRELLGCVARAIGSARGPALVDRLLSASAREAAIAPIPGGGGGEGGRVTTLGTPVTTKTHVTGNPRPSTPTPTPTPSHVTLSLARAAAAPLLAALREGLGLASHATPPTAAQLTQAAAAYAISQPAFLAQHAPALRSGAGALGLITAHAPALAAALANGTQTALLSMLAGAEEEISGSSSFFAEKSDSSSFFAIPLHDASALRNQSAATRVAALSLHAAQQWAMDVVARLVAVAVGGGADAGAAGALTSPRLCPDDARAHALALLALGLHGETITRVTDTLNRDSSLVWCQPPFRRSGVARAERTAAAAAADLLRRDARRALLIAFGEKLGRTGGGRSPEAAALKILASLSPRDAVLARELAVDSGIPLYDLESESNLQPPFRASSVHKAFAGAVEGIEAVDESNAATKVTHRGRGAVAVDLFSSLSKDTTVSRRPRMGISVSQPPGGTSTVGSVIAGDFGGVLDGETRGGGGGGGGERGRRPSSADAPRAAGRPTKPSAGDSCAAEPNRRISSLPHPQPQPQPQLFSLVAVSRRQAVLQKQHHQPYIAADPDDALAVSRLFSDVIITPAAQIGESAVYGTGALSQSITLALSVSEPLFQAAGRLHAASLAAVLLIGDAFGHVAALRGWALLAEGHLAAAAIDAIAAATGRGGREGGASIEDASASAVATARAAWADAAADYGLAAVTEACARGARARAPSSDAATPAAREAASLAALAARAAEGATPSISHFSRFSYTARTAATGLKFPRPPLVTLLERLDFTWDLSDAPLASRVISAASLLRYSSVHRFLLRVRAASVRLRNSRGALVGASRALRPRGVRGWSATGREDAAFLGSRAVPVSLFVFRHEAAHVITAFDGYVTTAVVSGAWRDFIYAAEEAAASGGGVDALRRAHEAYTMALEQRCFLPPQIASNATKPPKSLPFAPCNNEWRLVEELEAPSATNVSTVNAKGDAKTNGNANGTLALSGSGGSGAASLLDAILDAAVAFSDVVDGAIDTWTAGGANPDAAIFDMATLDQAARLARVFRGTTRALRAGLDAAYASGGGFAVHIADLRTRLGPA